LYKLVDALGDVQKKYGDLKNTAEAFKNIKVFDQNDLQNQIDSAEKMMNKLIDKWKEVERLSKKRPRRKR